MDLQRYWAVIWKWLWLIIIGVVIAGGISYLLSQRMEPVYRATATLVVNDTSNPEIGYDYTATTHAELIETYPVMEEVSSELEKLGIYYSPEELRKKISADADFNTPLIKVKAEDTDPATAKQIADATTDVYIEQHQGLLQIRVEASLNQIQTAINQASARIDELEEKDELTELTDAEQEELTALQADLEGYKSYRTALNLQLAQVMAAAGVSLGESATLPTSPVSPKTTQNIILACILGLVVTTGGVFLKEYLDRSVKTAEDISRLTGLPILGAIAKFKTNPEEKGGLITEAHPRSSIAEAFRMLRTNLQFASIDKPAQILLVTSPAPRDGKTSFVANLAVSIAQTGKKVIAVDTDLRHPQLHEILNVPNTIGFTNLLVAQQPDVAGFLQPTKVEGLRVLTSGPLAHNPAELLGSPRIPFLVEELRKEADIVLFDTAPVLAVADTVILAAKVDGAILVVKAGDTRPEALTEAQEALSKGNVNVLGVVLNQVEVSGRGSYYYHYRYTYPYYYSYGEDGEKKKRKRHHPTTSQESQKDSVDS